MTHLYRASLESLAGSQPPESVSYTSIVPPGWQGFCCYCRRRLTVADWQAGQIAAAGDGNPWHCLCLSHLKAGRRERKHALLFLAHAVSGI
jgi:hypothetical protein